MAEIAVTLRQYQLSISNELILDGIAVALDLELAYGKSPLNPIPLWDRKMWLRHDLERRGLLPPTT